MKPKNDQIRTYDKDGFRQRAACLCFKSECEAEVLLVSSSGSRNLWVVPGGGLEPEEKAEATAVREVHEEAGVVGRLQRLLDVFENTERNTRTYVYILIVENLEDEYDDAGKIGRIRKWFSLEEAIKKLSLHKPVQQEYLHRLSQDEIHLDRRSACCQFSSNAEHASLDSQNVESKCAKCCQAYHKFTEKVSEGLNVADKEVRVNGDAQAFQKRDRNETTTDKTKSNVRLIIEETNSDSLT